MARLEWVRQKLENWSRWCAQGDSGGLGYPRQSAFVRLGVSGGRPESFVPTDSLDASETDAAVAGLKLGHPDLHEVLTLHYAKNLDRAQVAKRMGRTERTIIKKLEDADYAVARWFEDKRAAQRCMARGSA